MDRNRSCFSKAVYRTLQSVWAGRAQLPTLLLEERRSNRTLSENLSMEAALIRGRWDSSPVARVYISDGFSFLPSLVLSGVRSAGGRGKVMS